nr:hypothetical protein CFP56_34713 [Quercus suber]
MAREESSTYHLLSRSLFGEKEGVPWTLLRSVLFRLLFLTSCSILSPTGDKSGGSVPNIRSQNPKVKAEKPSGMKKASGDRPPPYQDTCVDGFTGVAEWESTATTSVRVAVACRAFWGGLVLFLGHSGNRTLPWHERGLT